jgi:hypothetical protein
MLEAASKEDAPVMSAVKRALQRMVCFIFMD